MIAGIDCQSRKWFTRMPRQTWFGKKGEVEIDGMYRGWFSPRRFHQLAEHKGNLFLIGGRAREHKRLAERPDRGAPRPQTDADAGPGRALDVAPDRRAQERRLAIRGRWRELEAHQTGLPEQQGPAGVCC